MSLTRTLLTGVATLGIATSVNAQNARHRLPMTREDSLMRTVTDCFLQDEDGRTPRVVKMRGEKQAQLGTLYLCTEGKIVPRRIIGYIDRDSTYTPDTTRKQTDSIDVHKNGKRHTSGATYVDAPVKFFSASLEGNYYMLPFSMEARGIWNNHAAFSVKGKVLFLSFEEQCTGVPGARRYADNRPARFYFVCGKDHEKIMPIATRSMSK